MKLVLVTLAQGSTQVWISVKWIIDLYKSWVYGGISRLNGTRKVRVANIKDVNLKCKNLTNVHIHEYKNIARMLKIKLSLSETLGKKNM